VASNPFGGGFDSYLLSEITMPPAEGETEGVVIRGKAFHNSYIEVPASTLYGARDLFSGLILCAPLGRQRTGARPRRQG
jgi:hypothetical protein